MEEHITNYQAAGRSGQGMKGRDENAKCDMPVKPGVRGEEGETKEVILGRISKSSYLRRHR